MTVQHAKISVPILRKKVKSRFDWGASNRKLFQGGPNRAGAKGEILCTNQLVESGIEGGCFSVDTLVLWWETGSWSTRSRVNTASREDPNTYCFGPNAQMLGGTARRSVTMHSARLAERRAAGGREGGVGESRAGRDGAAGSERAAGRPGGARRVGEAEWREPEPRRRVEPGRPPAKNDQRGMQNPHTFESGQMSGPSHGTCRTLLQVLLWLIRDLLQATPQGRKRRFLCRGHRVGGQ